MGLNIKDPETERLAAEVAAVTGKSRTKATRLSFRVARRDRRERIRRLLEEEIWPLVPRSHLGVKVSRREIERILGYGRDGV